MILRCRACARQDHRNCEGTPEAGTCHCRQCHTRTIMDLARQAMDGNNLASIRTALQGVYALQL